MLCEKIAVVKWSDSSVSVAHPTENSNEIITNTIGMYNAVKEVLLFEDIIAVFMKIIEKIEEAYTDAIRKAQISNKTGAQRFIHPFVFSLSFLPYLSSLEVTCMSKLVSFFILRNLTWGVFTCL